MSKFQIPMGRGCRATFWNFWMSLLVGPWSLRIGISLGFGIWTLGFRTAARGPPIPLCHRSVYHRSSFRMGIMSENVNHYEQERRGKRDKLRELGVDPYGGREDGVRPLLEIKESYRPQMGHDGGPMVKGAGRIVLKRD